MFKEKKLQTKHVGVKFKVTMTKWLRKKSNKITFFKTEILKYLG